MKDKTIVEALFELHSKLSECKNTKELKGAVIKVALDYPRNIPDDFTIEFSKLKEIIIKHVSCVDSTNQEKCLRCNELNYCRFIVFMTSITELIASLVMLPSEVEVEDIDNALDELLMLGDNATIQ